MKLIKLFFIVTLFSTLSASAQLSKGNWMVGGNINFNYEKTERKNTNSMETVVLSNAGRGVYTLILQPQIGYFFVDKFVVGTGLNYTNSFLEGSKIDFSYPNFEIAPFVRYYFLQIDKPYNLFIEPSYAKEFSNQLGNIEAIGIKTGFVFFLNSSVGAETILNYRRGTRGDNTSTNIFLGFGLQIHLQKK